MHTCMRPFLTEEQAIGASYDHSSGVYIEPAEFERALEQIQENVQLGKKNCDYWKEIVATTGGRENIATSIRGRRRGAVYELETAEQNLKLETHRLKNFLMYVTVANKDEMQARLERTAGEHLQLLLDARKVQASTVKLSECKISGV